MNRADQRRGRENSLADLIGRRGTLIVVSGPSGSGKNRVISEVLKVTHGLEYSISTTTRPRRAGERDGVNYHFMSPTQFEGMIRQGDLLEYAEVYGNFYGTPRKPIEDMLAAGRDVILDLDVQGARQIRERCRDAVLVFLLPPSIAELERRIRSRGTDDEETIQRRMGSALREISALAQYTYAIVNDELEDAVRSLICIIEAERCRTSRFVLDSSSEPLWQPGCG